MRHHCLSALRISSQPLISSVVVVCAPPLPLGFGNPLPASSIFWRGSLCDTTASRLRSRISSQPRVSSGVVVCATPLPLGFENLLSASSISWRGSLCDTTASRLRESPLGLEHFLAWLSLRHHCPSVSTFQSQNSQLCQYTQTELIICIPRDQDAWRKQSLHRIQMHDL